MMKRLKSLERLENRLCLSSVWQNPDISADVDASGHVSALDALLLVNRIRRTASASTNRVTVSSHELTYANLDDAAEQIALSRIFAGTQFRFDTEQGLALGRQVADEVLANLYV